MDIDMNDDDQSPGPYYVSVNEQVSEEPSPAKNKGKGRRVTFNEAEVDFAEMETPYPEGSEDLNYLEENQDEWGDDELDELYDDSVKNEDGSPGPSSSTFLHGTRGEGTGMVWGDSDEDAYAGPVRRGPTGVRVRGGRAALPKPVTADLDSEDEIILRMKEDGFTDQQVVDKLKEENRVRYDRKTIGSRFIRIQSALAAKQDERLEDEETDWHEGEDELLLDAVACADARIALLTSKLEARRFTYAADKLHKLKPRTRYSPKACQERYVALMGGTAHIPYELDDNPEQRYAERMERVRIKREAKEKETAEKKAREEALRVFKEEQALRNARKREEAAVKRAQTMAAKAQRAQEIAEKRVAAAEKAGQRRAEVENKNRLLKAAKEARQRQEAEAAAAKARIEAARKAVRTRGEAARKLKEEAAKSAAPSAQASPATKNGKKSAGIPIDPALEDASASTTSSPAPQTSATPARITRSMSAATDGSVDSASSASTDPRSHMTVVELQAELDRRGLQRSGKKQDLVDRLCDADDHSSVNVLKDHLRAFGAMVSGNRAELLARLPEATLKAAVAKRGAVEKRTPVKKGAVLSSEKVSEEDMEEDEGSDEGGVAAEDVAEKNATENAAEKDAAEVAAEDGVKDAAEQ